MKKSRLNRAVEAKQEEFTFPRRGGVRAGAGRKPKGRVAGPSHAARRALAARHPLLVTHRLCSDLPNLRATAEFDVICEAISDATKRDGFRIVHFSVQSNHVHYLCEAHDTESLTNGMRGLGVMIARRLNRLWQRSGPALADRFHARALETPIEVRYALAYVLNNARKHGILGGSADPFSSGPWFDGWSAESATIWSDAREDNARRSRAVPVVAAQTWLLRIGWRRHGLLDRRETPGGQVRRRAQARADQRSLDSIQRSLAEAARAWRARRVTAPRAYSVQRR